MSMKRNCINLAMDYNSTSLLLGEPNTAVKHHRCNSDLFRLVIPEFHLKALILRLQ